MSTYTINPLNHKGIVFQIAKRMNLKFPQIDINDIIQEINLLIIEYSSPIPIPEKDENGEIIKGQGKLRTTKYCPFFEESTFITNIVGKKIETRLLFRYTNFQYKKIDENQSEIEKINNGKKMKISKNKEVDYYIKVSMQQKNEDDTSMIQDTTMILNAFETMYNNRKSNSMATNEMMKIIEESSLDDFEKQLVLLRYGFITDTGDSMTLEEIGENLGKTKEAIRKRLEKIKDKLYCNKRIKELA